MDSTAFISGFIGAQVGRLQLAAAGLGTHLDITV